MDGLRQQRLVVCRMAWIAVCLSLFACVFHARACEIPVFRYALERWQAVPCRLIVFLPQRTEGSFTPEQRGLMDALGQSNRCEVETCDVSALPDSSSADATPPALNIWNQLPCKPALPALTLCCWGGKDFVPDAAYSRPLQREMVDMLVKLPYHREVARRLMTGDSAVWVLLTVSNSSKNASARKMLGDALQSCEQTLKLPNELDPNDTTYDTPVNSGVALRLRFSLLEVPGSAAEADLFRSAVRTITTNAATTTEPVAIPVFGRGLALDAFSGAMLEPKTVRDVCEFLCGACSCSVKEMRPGVNLYMPVDWDAEVTQSPLVEALPSLTVPGATNAIGPQAQPGRTNVVAVAGTQRINVSRSLGALLAIGLLILIAGTLHVMRGRKGDS